MTVSRNDVGRAVEIGRRSHRRLLAVLHDRAAGGDLDPTAPTRLPGWNTSMLITHLARNADSHVRMIDGALAGACVAQYDGGLPGRDAEIEAGRNSTVDELLADLAAAIDRLETAWTRTDRENRDWQGFGMRGDRRTPIADLPFLRVREVELHHVDLDIGTTWDDVDTTYLRLETARLEMLWRARQPMGVTSLPPVVVHLPPPRRLAWLTGRLSVDGIPPANLL